MFKRNRMKNVDESAEYVVDIKLPQESEITKEELIKIADKFGIKVKRSATKAAIYKQLSEV